MTETLTLPGLTSLSRRLGVPTPSVQQERAIALLLRGQRPSMVANAVGVTAATIKKWMEDGHPFRVVHDYLRDERGAWELAQVRVDRDLLTTMLFEAHRKAATATEEISAIRELGKMHGLYESDKKQNTTEVVVIQNTEQIRRAPTEKLLELIGADVTDIIPTGASDDRTDEDAV